MTENIYDARFPQLATHLRSNGLEILGDFRHARDCEKGAMFGLMIINSGREMWPKFRESKEWNDRERDPLDRWSERVISQAAKGLGAELCLPSQKPFQPFQQWAIDAGGLAQSPLGILVHPQYGLWFGLRGALIFPLNVSIQHVEKVNQESCAGESICEKCYEKPCLTHCPVNAFSAQGLDVTACYSHLDTREKPNCMSKGCAARGACPAGSDHQYGREQLQFHMKSYRGKIA